MDPLSVTIECILAIAKLLNTSSALPVFQTRWRCEICKVTVSSELTLQSHLRGKKHRAKAKAKAKLWCALCNLRVSDEIDMIAHLKGKRHLAKLQKTFISKPVIPAVAKLPDTSSALPVFRTRWTCEICEVTVSSELTLQSHRKGKRHLAKLLETSISKPVIPAVTELPDTSSALPVFQTRWTCEICEVTVSSEMTLQSHLSGKKHRAEAKLWCAFCNLRVSGEIDMIAHLKGKRHLAKLQKTFTNSGSS